MKPSAAMVHEFSPLLQGCRWLPGVPTVSTHAEREHFGGGPGDEDRSVRREERDSPGGLWWSIVVPMVVNDEMNFNDYISGCK